MSTHTGSSSRKVTTERLRQMKQRGQKIACLTAYDALMAEILDRSNLDVRTLDVLLTAPGRYDVLHAVAEKLLCIVSILRIHTGYSNKSVDGANHVAHVESTGLECGLVRHVLRICRQASCLCAVGLRAC